MNLPNSEAEEENLGSQESEVKSIYTQANISSSDENDAYSDDDV